MPLISTSPAKRNSLKKLGENSFKDQLLAFLLRSDGFRIRTDLKDRGETRWKANLDGQDA